MAEVRLALLPGDGIGREVMAAARGVLASASERFSLNLVFDEIPCGGQYFLTHGRDWPEDGEARCTAADVMLLGAVGWPHPSVVGPVMRPDGHMAGYSAVLGNRTRFDLYANVRPVKLWPNVQHKLSGRLAQVWPPDAVDLVVLRENTEGLYVGAGGTLRPGGQAQVATDTRIITWRGAERICRRAFETALGRSAEPKVTAVAKHNVLDGCRLFVEAFHAVAADHPEVEAEVMIVDAFAQALMQSPERFDVVVTTNLFGDILTDLAAVLQGGLGMAVGGNLGDGRAMFEPIHGSAPDIAGTGRANPLAMLSAAGWALRWCATERGDAALLEAGQAVEASVVRILEDPAEPRTPDLGGRASTSEVAAAVTAGLRRA